jgi:hypothetical protein
MLDGIAGPSASQPLAARKTIRAWARSRSKNLEPRIDAVDVIG